VNHLEIEAMAAEAGFAIVYPEDLDFIDQASLLRSARFVIGPEGSALSLCAFLNSGARVCVLNHQETEGLALYNGGGDLNDDYLTLITGPRVGSHLNSQDVDYRVERTSSGGFLTEWASASNRS
jgi:hypothetical protein